MSVFAITLIFSLLSVIESSSAKEELQYVERAIQALKALQGETGTRIREKFKPSSSVARRLHALLDIDWDNHNVETDQFLGMIRKKLMWIKQERSPGLIADLQGFIGTTLTRLNEIQGELNHIIEQEREANGNTISHHIYGSPYITERGAKSHKKGKDDKQRLLDF